MIRHRTKEIAGRKVLGGSIHGMVYLFSKDFIRLVAVANVIAMPVVYLLGDRWLKTFSFHVGIGWAVLVTPAVVLLSISLITVWLQTIRTGSQNPVKALKVE